VSPSSRSSVAVDLHLLGSRETGNETYARELAIALCARSNFDFRLLVPDRTVLPHDLRSHPGVIEIGRLPSAIRVGFQYPRLVSNLRVGLVHMPTYVLPPFLRCASVITVLDVSYLVRPELVEPRIRWMLKALVGPSIRAANRVITISESSKRDIVTLYRVDPDKVVVTPLAAAKQFKRVSSDEVQRVRSTYAISAPYVLSVGNILPRKNLARLVEAFSTIAAEIESVQLVIVGRSLWKGSDVERLVHELGLVNRIQFLGYVPDADLPALYSGAEVFCFPSIHEGFGLPVLEAMACGVPTLTSDSSSLPEVVGDAGLMFPPESVADIAALLRHTLLDQELRVALASKGLHRAASFSWDFTAQLTEEAYRDAFSRATPPSTRSEP
jgi:glycosyltransferase involved in cell wall biosynthesis